MMVHRILIVLLLTCGLSLVLTIGIVAQSPDHSANGTNKVIIVLQPAQSAAAPGVAVLHQLGALGLYGLEPLGMEGPVPGTAAYLGQVAPGVDVTGLIRDLERFPFVLRAELDAPRRFFAIDPDTGPLDEEFTYQGYYFDIGVVAMWARGLTGISATHPITVAAIDTGVDLDHLDIDENLVTGYDFVEMDQFPQDADPYSHGSMVSGVIGAEINNDVGAVDVTSDQARGVAGIGGGDALSGTLGLRVMPLRVAADSWSGFDCATSAQAIDYATDHGAQVINMSYGGPDACALELDAVQRAYEAGVALVAGAGNGNTSTPFYPAAYGAGTNDYLVIAVAGLYPSGVKADSSNYGIWVDIGAPFRLIRSITKNGGYASASGTSFSTPFVSGLTGVLMSNYGWSRNKALSIILASADNVDDVEGNAAYQGLLGAGRINADRASAVIQDVYLPLVLHNF